jgi:hypothetical protein
MASSPGARPLRLPPPDLATRALPKTRDNGRTWFRLHAKGTSALLFSLKPTHRFSHPDCPCSVLYLAIDPETCLWERFGDCLLDSAHTLPRTHWEDAVLSSVEVPPILLCDFTRTATRVELSVDLSALMNPDISLPQEWGLAVQRHPDQVSAIRYRSRFTNAACLALFDRGTIRSQIRESLLSPASHSDAALEWLTRHEVVLV